MEMEMEMGMEMEMEMEMGMGMETGMVTGIDGSMDCSYSISSVWTMTNTAPEGVNFTWHSVGSETELLKQCQDARMPCVDVKVDPILMTVVMVMVMVMVMVIGDGDGDRRW